jgi:SAM-dependent methyltransferase
MAARVRSGNLPSDEEFDLLYDDWSRRLSPHYWTPIAVARRAAQLLAEDGRRRVLDIGSGVGKFCLVGALTTGALFVGIEQRPNLVAAARAAAARLGTRRSRFLIGDFAELDFRRFDGFYLFNPFEELLTVGMEPIDTTVDLSPARFRRNLRWLSSKLRRAPDDATVVTYFGHGERELAGFRQVRKEFAGEDALVVWRKR